LPGERGRGVPLAREQGKVGKKEKRKTETVLFYWRRKREGSLFSIPKRKVGEKGDRVQFSPEKSKKREKRS